MSPRKKERKDERHRQKKRFGPWFKFGRIFIILGAILIIIVAVIDILNLGFASEAWQSYTFGYLGIPVLSLVIAIICGILILWMSIDNRFPNRMNLILYALVIIILAIVTGNIGGLVCIIGAILIFFEVASRS